MSHTVSLSLLLLGVALLQGLSHSDALCTSIPDCLSCPRNADGIPICDKCKPGTGMFFDTGNPYLTDGRPCRLCREMDGCWLCKNNTVCELCKSPGEMGPDRNGVGTCSKCIEHCRFCGKSGGGKCDRCEPGFFYDKENNECIQCGQDCDSCDYSKAGKCDACLKGYFLDEGKCKACIRNCDRCANSNTCKHCAKGFFPITPFECRACVANCDVCNNANSCKYCALGYYRKGNDCISCGRNCAYCDREGGGKCQKCKDGRVPPNGSCDILF